MDVAQEPGLLDEDGSQKWESMSLERCVRGMAYEMRLVFEGIYERQDVGGARKQFGNGCASVRATREQTGELLEPMASIARNLEGILAYWPRGLATSFMGY